MNINNLGEFIIICTKCGNKVKIKDYYESSEHNENEYIRKIETLSMNENENDVSVFVTGGDGNESICISCDCGNEVTDLNY